MSQVIKEGLRLYPSVGLFQREATEDIEIGKTFNFLFLINFGS